MIEFRLDTRPWQDDIDVLIVDRSNSTTSVVKSLVFEKLEIGHRALPTLSLERSQAQSLMDELWRCGVRPTEGSGSAGSLAATERHLKDMQIIAFDLLKRQ